MGKAKYFNKGTLRGIVSKSEIIDFEKNGKKGSFLSMEIFTGNSNRIKGTVFPTEKNPNKHNEIHNMFPVNTKVEVVGSVRESEYESNGKKGIDRSLSINSINPMPSDAQEGAFFILQGIVTKIKEKDDGGEITLELDTSYEDKKTKKMVERSEIFTMSVDAKALADFENQDVVKGCNAKFKGNILNKLEFDGYGDVVGSVQMFKTEKVDTVIQKDELDKLEDTPSFI